MEMGKVQYIMMHYVEAANNFAAALAFKDVNKCETLYNLGLANLQQGKYAEALTHLEYYLIYVREAINITPNLYEVDILVTSGIAYSKLGKKDRALDSFNKALDKSPCDPELMTNIGNIHFENGQYELAAEQFLTALKTAPNDVEILSNLGNTLTKLKDYQHAWVAFDEAIKINPTNASVIENYLLCLLDAKLIDVFENKIEQYEFLPEDSKRKLNDLANEYRITLGIRSKKPAMKKKKPIINKKLDI